MPTYSRPNIPYTNTPSPNDTRFDQMEKQRKLVNGKYFDQELNYLIDTANALQAAILNTQAGGIDGSSTLGNQNMILSTDGDGHLNWIQITDKNCKAKSLTRASIASNTITSAEIANGSLADANYGAKSIPSGAYKDNSILTNAYGPNSIPASAFSGTSIPSNAYGNGSIPTTAYADASITGNKIASGTIIGGNIATKTIDATKILESTGINGGATLTIDSAGGTASFQPVIPVGCMIEYWGMTGVAFDPKINVGFDTRYWAYPMGQELLVNNYPELYKVIGNTYGTSNTGVSFKLPDRRGTVAINIGSDGTSGSIKPTALTPANSITLGGTTGEQMHTLTVAEMPAHTHGAARAGGQTGGGAGGGVTCWVGQGLSDPTGGNQPHNNLQPSMFCYHLIRIR